MCDVCLILRDISVGDSALVCRYLFVIMLPPLQCWLWWLGSNSRPSEYYEAVDHWGGVVYGGSTLLC